MSVGHNWMAQPRVWLNLVSVAPPHFVHYQVPAGDEIGHDPMDSAFGDADAIGDVSERQVGLRGDA